MSTDPVNDHLTQSLRQLEAELEVVDFSIKTDDWFTTDEALQYLLEKKVIPRITGTGRKVVRELLSDGLLFQRIGERKQTRWRKA